MQQNTRLLQRCPRRWLAARAALGGLALATLLSACGGGGLLAVLAGLFGSAPASVPLVLFPGGDRRKPALLLPFTAELSAIAPSPDGRRLYVGDSLHQTINVFDTARRQLIAVLDVGTGPRSLLVSADGSQLYVAHYGLRNSAASSISVFDTASFARREIAVGNRPAAMAEDAARGRLYVATLGSRELFAFDTASLAPLRTLSFDGQPAALLLGDGGERVYVALRSTESVPISDRVLVYAADDFLPASTGDARAGILLPANAGPQAMALTADGMRLLVVNREHGSVSLIDTASASLQTTLEVGPGPQALAIGPRDARAWVARGFSGDEEDLCGVDAANAQNSLAVLDLDNDEVLANDIRVGDAPIAVALYASDVDAARVDKVFTLSACGSSAGVTASGEGVASGPGSISRLDVAALEAGAAQVVDIPLPAGRGVALAGAGSALWLVHPDAISLFDAAAERITAEIAARGPGPQRLALNPAGDRLHASLPGLDAVATLTIDASAGGGETLLARQPTGRRPSALAVTAGGTLVVANGGYSRTPGDSVSLFDSASGNPLGSVLLEDNVDPGLLGRGPIALAAVATGTAQTAYVAAFGGSLPDNDRDPGQFVARLDASSGELRQFPDFDSFEWFSDVAVDGDAQVYTASFFDNRVRRHDAPAFADAGISPDQFAANRPAQLLPDADGGVWVSSYTTESASYAGADINAGQVTHISSGGVEIDQPLPGGIPARAAIEARPAALGGDRLWTLHAGDRSVFCQVEGDFCSSDGALSVLALDAVPAALDDIPRIAVGRSPRGIAFAAGHAFVGNYFDATLSVIDSASLQLVATIPVGGGPMDLLAVGDRVYVANSLDGTLSVIDAAQRRLLRTVDLLE